MTFTRMDDSTQEQWMTIAVEHAPYIASTSDRILDMLRSLEGFTGGFGVHQLHHALQTATMAERAGASEELIVAALCHDVGKAVSVPNHAAIAAEILRPYVSDETYHVLRTHQDFQGRHYYAHYGMDPTLREQYRDEPWFAQAEQFTDEWDQAAFDPDYPVEPLEHFEPLVRRVFASPRKLN